MFFKCLSQRKTFCTLAKKPFYVTTPIFYVNAAPHIGHLYSAVIADATYRFERLLGQHSEYYLATGTDEHGSKIQQAAESRSISTDQYCQQISQQYRILFKNFNVDYTHFIRTTDSAHKKAVHHFWNLLKSKGHIYSTNYSGWYCVPDESFLVESQLREENGKFVSAESGHPVEWTKEQNYMFKLSNFQEDVLYWLKSGTRIRPQVFEKILLDTLNQGPLPDISVSRPIERVHWGITVPNDDTQTIYVWLDALVNYLTCAGYPDESYRKMWPANVQIIGKDIMKFHAIYWPAFLIAAGLEPPESLLVHSHWTVDGQKMSKSKFNVVDPNERAPTYTYDGLRYFLLREGVPHSDGNYSDTKVVRILNAELANTFGNLLSRGCAKSLNDRHVFPKLHKPDYRKLLERDITKKLVGLVEQLPDKCYQHYKSYNFYMVIDQVMECLHVANNFFETCKPWELSSNKKSSADDDVSNIQKRETILSITMETLRICSIICQPIIPMMSQQLLDKLNVDKCQRNWKDLEYFLWNNNNNDELSSSSTKDLGKGNSVLFNRIRLPITTADVQIDKKEKLNNKRKM